MSLIGRLRENCNEGRLIFDRYLPGSLTEVTRKKRSENTNSVRYKISNDMNFKHIFMKSLLSHLENKGDITFFLKDDVLQAFEASPT